jgi:hypothetical protein
MLARRLTSLAAAAGLAALALACPPAHAQAPAVLRNPSFGFPIPGGHVSAANAASAGVALADRWLGTTGYENPATGLPQGIEITPVFQRVSRQDLSSQNRDFDQVVGYPDLAGARFSLPAGDWGFTLYAWQPLLRLEEISFTAGPLLTPAFVRLLTSQREIRAGGAVSRALGAARVGVSGEWVHREDFYETHEQTGSAATSGDRRMDLQGDGFGVSAGMTWDKDTDRPWGSWFGAALRYGAEIPATGTYTGINDSPDALAPDTTYGFDAARATQWSGGASGRVTVAPATRVVLGFSFGSAEDWTGLGLKTDAAFSWSAGLDWKDDELPWGARFGVGQETQSGAVEEKSGLLSVGFTWVSGDLVLDAGILHRNLARGDLPRSSDDRGVLSVRFAF